MNRRPKHCCQACAAGAGGVCDAPVGHGQHQPVENWWSPRSAPDPGHLQAGIAQQAHTASLYADTTATNQGLHGGPVTFWQADQPAAALGLVHPARREAKAVPPAQTTLISPRWTD